MDAYDKWMTNYKVTSSSSRYSSFDDGAGVYSIIKSSKYNPAIAFRFFKEARHTDDQTNE